MLLLRTMLGLEPHDEHLVVDPALPKGMGRLELLDIPGRWGKIDAFGRGRVDIHHEQEVVDLESERSSQPLMQALPDGR
jgi:hypothetical protein